METIFTLLLIVLPLAFKLIGKKLESAGQQPGKPVAGSSEPVEDWAEVLRRHLESQQQAQGQVKQPEDVQKTPEMKIPEKKSSAHVKKPVTQVAKVTKPILKESKERKKEKIDAKKLIIYSEIMKPKYNE